MHAHLEMLSENQRQVHERTTVATIAFRSQPLPGEVAGALRARLEAAHRTQPFSVLDARSATRRAAQIADDLGLGTTVIRGGLDLDGSEVDHVWLDVDGRVIDVTFPVFLPAFVVVLRDFVAGHADAAELAQVAGAAHLEHRVLGEFPVPLRYRGAPVWSASH